MGVGFGQGSVPLTKLLMVFTLNNKTTTLLGLEPTEAYRISVVRNTGSQLGRTGVDGEGGGDPSFLDLN
jgi:hypothetical protein